MLVIQALGVFGDIMTAEKMSHVCEMSCHQHHNPFSDIQWSYKETSYHWKTKTKRKISTISRMVPADWWTAWFTIVWCIFMVWYSILVIFWEICFFEQNFFEHRKRPIYQRFQKFKNCLFHMKITLKMISPIGSTIMVL